MNQKYLDEEKVILNNILDTFLRGMDQGYMARGGKQYRTPEEFFGSSVELIIRPQCNQKCEYCYITQHGKELYPVKERISNEQILKNLDILLNYFYNQKKYKIYHYELFAGDLFYDDLFFDIMDVFYPYLKNFSETYRDKLIEGRGIILIPSNAYALITDDNRMARYKEYVKKFSEIYFEIAISWSTDGKYAIDSREQKTLPDDYWDKGFKFIEEMGYGFHPMLSYENIDTAIENYNWMKEQINKYNLFAINQPIYLAVRNHGWTDEKIQKYIEFLDYIIKDRFAQCHNSVKEFAHHLFIGNGHNGYLKRYVGFDPLELEILDFNHDRLSCNIQQSIHINIQNMSIAPCHRLTYQHFIAGYFKVENDEIIDIIPHNISTYAAILFTKNNVLPKCSNCIYRDLCTKGCLGAQYEYSGELMTPIPDVCKMKQATISFLVKRFAEMGVLREAIDNLLTDEPWKINILTDFCNRKGYQV